MAEETLEAVGGARRPRGGTALFVLPGAAAIAASAGAAWYVRPGVHAAWLAAETRTTVEPPPLGGPLPLDLLVADLADEDGRRCL